MATKAEEAYELLLDLIEEGVLAPGDFLSESSLIERLDLGRTPLREALQRLNLERMIDIVPGRGIQIAPNSVDAQLQRLELRRPIEALAYSLACKRATVVELEELAQLTRVLSEAEQIGPYRSALRATQNAIVEAAHNDYLSVSMAPLQGLSRRFWLTHLADGSSEMHRGKQHHLRALEAVLRRDMQAAQQASWALNDYLVEFSVDVLRERAMHGADIAE
ncbi:GntR family transcriptional regulator [Leucobacter sp. wl10]|uniref:GntR family transcriptional regulator n=1 Tax=Leucobacter sp. wl10 TaxID=2304677 RepID=UPI000E5A9C60|nr:GntR family transcriptional regulator [Leucobacter sp. wl10]RGE24387.1 GntR family transcriptional regulator [Leucobacter sp. wl10]